MTTNRLRLTAMFVLALLAFTVPTFAQRGDDRDGDGIPDSVDACPANPGPRENSGCPLPDSGAATPDRDSDGVPDYVDGCPDEVGTGYSNGCPADLAPDTAPPDQQTDPPLMTFTWGSTVHCMVGLLPTAATNVNVREQATTSSAIIGQLASGQQFAPFFRDYDENGNVWFGGAPAGDSWGWVAGSVVIDNGLCANLPMVIHIDMPFQFDIQLTLDPDLLPDSIPYWTIRMKQVFVDSVSFSLLVPDDLVVTEGDGGTTTSDGGVEHTDNWDTPTFFVLPDLLPEEDNPLLFEPLLLVKLIDPNAPEENCADIGEGYCLLAGLLLPAFGDAPGQCPPQTFVEGLQAAFLGGGAASGDGDSDGADFLIWQRNLGSGAAIDPASTLIHQYAINGNSLGLLLPAVQAAREAASHSAEPKPGMKLSLAGDGSVLPTEQISFVFEQIEWNYNESCPILGFAPSGETIAMGDGSVRPVYQWSVTLLPYIEQS